MKNKQVNDMNENISVKDKKTKKVKKENGGSSFLVLKIVIAAVLVVVVAYFGFTFEVREGSCAVVLRFGAPREEITEAGLYFKLPWPFETVVKYENRIQCLESNYLETTTKDNRNIILQSYALWQVGDPLTYHNSVGSKESVDGYIKDQISSATNSVLGSYNLSQLVSLETENIKIDEIQEKIFMLVKENCEKNYGIIVKDVSILRLSLPDTNLESVFEQMKADRQKDIDTILAEAARDANKITTEADKDAAEIIAGGVEDAAAIRAQTEKEVAAIYSAAQAENLELFKFLKELDTIVSSVDDGSVLVVTADSYPFNILLNYSDMITDESDEQIIEDLNYILSQLPEKERNDLVVAIYDLIEKAGEVKQ